MKPLHIVVIILAAIIFAFVVGIIFSLLRTLGYEMYKDRRERRKAVQVV